MDQKYIGGLVDFDVWKHLRDTAKRLDLTIAQIVRRAVQEWLERNVPKTEM